MKRDLILLSTLYLVDEDIVPKDLILYLDENVSRDEAITPDTMMSVCFMFWAISPKTYPTSSQVEEVRNHLNHCLGCAWQHQGKGHWLERVSILQKRRMRGWRISLAHRLRKISEVFNVPVK